jgi:hypothetical protein
MVGGVLRRKCPLAEEARSSAAAQMELKGAMTSVARYGLFLWLRVGGPRMPGQALRTGLGGYDMV